MTSSGLHVPTVFMHCNLTKASLYASACQELTSGIAFAVSWQAVLAGGPQQMRSGSPQQSPITAMRAPSFGAPTGGAGPLSPARSSSGYLAPQQSGMGLAGGPSRSGGSLTRPLPPQPAVMGGGSPTGGALAEGSGLGDMTASGATPNRPGMSLGRIQFCKTSVASKYETAIHPMSKSNAMHAKPK